MRSESAKQVRTELKRFVEHIVALPDWEEYDKQLLLVVKAQTNERRLPDDMIERIADCGLSVLCDGELLALAGSIADLKALDVVLSNRMVDDKISPEWMAIIRHEVKADVDAVFGEGTWEADGKRIVAMARGEMAIDIDADPELDRIFDEAAEECRREFM